MTARSSSARSRRIADLVQRELAQVVREQMQDPRVRRVTFTEVDVSPDLAHANVFYSLLGDASEVEQCGRALHRAAGFLRAELSHRTVLRHAPQLHFIHDPSVERGVRLSQLIDEANAGSHADGETEVPPSGASGD